MLPASVEGRVRFNFFLPIIKVQYKITAKGLILLMEYLMGGLSSKISCHCKHVLETLVIVVNMFEVMPGTVSVGARTTSAKEAGTAISKI